MKYMLKQSETYLGLFSSVKLCTTRIIEREYPPCVNMFARIGV